MKKLFTILSIAVIISGLLSCGATTDKTAKTFKVVGYLPAGRVDTAAIPYQYLTHINYSFAIPAKGGSGELMPVPRPETLAALVRNAHRHQVKVFISIGGWGIGDGGGNDTRFEVLAGRQESRTRFVESVMALIRRFQLDGADIDWEYPDPIEPSATDYVLLMTQLRDSLHAAGKKLTAAIVSYHDLHGYGIKKEIFAITDWLNIMAYDDDYNTFHGADVPHAPYWLCVRAFDYWVGDRGLPAAKAIMGVPFYGKGPKARYWPYRRLLARGADPNADVYDSIYYNGIKTMRQKTRLALKRGGGIMIWEISLDSAGQYSLLKAIHEEVKKEE